MARNEIIYNPGRFTTLTRVRDRWWLVVVGFGNYIRVLRLNNYSRCWEISSGEFSIQPC